MWVETHETWLIVITDGDTDDFSNNIFFSFALEHLADLGPIHLVHTSKWQTGIIETGIDIRRLGRKVHLETVVHVEVERVNSHWVLGRLVR